MQQSAKFSHVSNRRGLANGRAGSRLRRNRQAAKHLRRGQSHGGRYQHEIERSAQPHRLDSLAALRGWIRPVTRTPAGRMLAGLVAEAQRDPALAAAWRERVFEPLRASNTVLVRRAIDRGEIPAGTDADVVLDLLFGSAYHRLLQGHRPLTDRFARQVTDLIVAGVRAPLGARRGADVHARLQAPESAPRH